MPYLRYVASMNGCTSHEIGERGKMGYYSVMLVDDEEDARKSINKKINWEELGFQVIESAENGEEALEKAERLRPDVIMTDIHMPFMDGITFCKRLRSRFIDSKIVIFSGYDDFEYAKEAIKLEVEEYILKPIDSEELYQVFQRVKNRLDDEIYQKKNIERLERYYYESEPFLREQYFINLLEGRLEASQIVDYQEMYDITIPGDFYSVAIIKADKRKKESIHPSIQSNLVSVSLLQIASEQLEKMFQYTILNYLGEIVVIVYFQREERIGDFIHTIDRKSVV